MNAGNTPEFAQRGEKSILKFPNCLRFLPRRKSESAGDHKPAFAHTRAIGHAADGAGHVAESRHDLSRPFRRRVQPLEVSRPAHIFRPVGLIQSVELRAALYRHKTARAPKTGYAQALRHMLAVVPLPVLLL